MVIMNEEAHVAREEPRGRSLDNAHDALELVIFVGLQASGKSTFFRERFATTHELVSKDLLRNNKNPLLFRRVRRAAPRTHNRCFHLRGPRGGSWLNVSLRQGVWDGGRVGEKSPLLPAACLVASPDQPVGEARTPGKIHM